MGGLEDRFNCSGVSITIDISNTSVTLYCFREQLAAMGLVVGEKYVSLWKCLPK